MFTLQKRRNFEKIIDIKLNGSNLEESLCKEWLLTNDRGGFCSSTVYGCNTRRYHGLLTGSLNPPVSRINALSGLIERLSTQQGIVNLSSMEFEGSLVCDGAEVQKSFIRDGGVHFRYVTDSVTLVKSIYLHPNRDVVAVVYEFERVDEPVTLQSRPLTGLRDFHSLQKSYASLCCEDFYGCQLIRHCDSSTCELLLSSGDMDFTRDEQWWYDFVYRADKERGQDHTEDLWSCGFYSKNVESPCQIVLWGSFKQQHEASDTESFDLQQMLSELKSHEDELLEKASATDEISKTLCLAADQFVTKRASANGQRTTILAGYPWFADWGRDAFISFGGLLLFTGRWDEALDVLSTFAAAADEGMIPNRFDDRTSETHFNSIDASLWFIRAAFEYLDVTGDEINFSKHLLGTIRQIIDSYQHGTKFGIHAETDGLITGGSEDTQLTWMDAKCDGVCFTPRYGKAVEINALWYSALCQLAEYYAGKNVFAANKYHLMADKVEQSFSQLFWNAEKGYCNDCIHPDGNVDSSLRPNQLVAISCKFSALSAEQQQSVVATVERELLSEMGIRTLTPNDTNYKGIYTGCAMSRDAAYHQGTVWPYLMGGFVEAYLKAHGFSQQSKDNAGKIIEPLLTHLTANGCLGSICEIFDGDEPGTPKGCIAQAWSVAELIRSYRLIRG